jgi:hypothetical protein
MSKNLADTRVFERGLGNYLPVNELIARHILIEK